MNFNTVNEVTQWRSFVLDGVTYDLSHLNAQRIEYVDKKDPDKPTSYWFIVTYGLHCFTKNSEELPKEESRQLIYKGPKESRPFNLERYELSKHLPRIVESLGNRETLVCHAGYGKYAIVKLLNSNGCDFDYFVPFVAFKESRKLRLHVQSAYPRRESSGKINKVSFFVIARNLLHNKKITTTPKITKTP